MSDLPVTGVVLTADQITEFLHSMNQALDAVQKFGSAGKQSGGQIDAFGQIAIGALRQIGVVAVDLAMNAGRQLVGFLQEAIAEASDSEQVFARLGAAITASGGVGPAMKDLAGWVDAGASYMKKLDADGSFSYKLKEIGTQSNFTLQQAKALSMQFRDLAGGSDEAVAGIIDMGVRMGTVSSAEMPKFITSVLDIAAATGTDAVTAARNLAQSLDDPIGAMGRFARMGLKVNEATEAQIKDLVKQGKTQEAVAILTDALAKKSAGAALLMSKTWKGQMDIMTGHIKEGFETVGLSLLPFLEKANVALMPFIDNLEHTAALIAAWVTGMGALFQTAGLGAVLERIFPPGIAQQVGGLIDTIMRLGTDVWTTIQPFVTNFGGFIKDLMAATVPQILTNLQGALDGFATFWATSGPGIVLFADTVLRMAAITGMGAVVFLTGLADAVGRLLANDAGGFLDRLGGSLVTLAETMSGMDLGPGLAAWQGVWDNFKIIVETVWSGITTTISTAISSVKTSIADIVASIDAMIAKWKKVILPDWLEHHSPSELELSFTGIDKALGHLVRGSLDRFSSGIAGMALPQTLAPAMASSSIMAGASYDNSRAMNVYGGINNMNPLTAQAFDAAMRAWLGA